MGLHPPHDRMEYGIHFIGHIYMMHSEICCLLFSAFEPSISKEQWAAAVQRLDISLIHVFDGRL